MEYFYSPLTGGIVCEERLGSGRLGEGVKLGGVGVVKEWRGGRTCGDTWTIVEPPGRDTTTPPADAAAVLAPATPERGGGVPKAAAGGLDLITTFCFVCTDKIERGRGRERERERERHFIHIIY